MTTSSQLLSVDLPDNNGKTVSFYTYDGYLEEAERTRIRRDFRSLEQLCVTGPAIFAFAAFVVKYYWLRLQEDSHFPSSVLKDAQYQLQVFFQQEPQGWLATAYSICTDQPENPQLKEMQCWDQDMSPSGPISETQSTPTELSSNWLMSVTMSPWSSTQDCTHFIYEGLPNQQQESSLTR